MANEAQAQADSETETPVVDPLDATNSQIGTTDDFTSYEDEVEAFKRGEVADGTEDEQREQSADDQDPVDEFEAEDEQVQDEETEEERDDASVKSQERFRFKSDEDKAVAAIAKARNVSLVEAARIYSGDQPAQAQQSTQQQEAEQSESLASVESELESLYEKKDAAIRAIDVDEQAELEKQIRALEKKARTLAVVETQAQIAAREAAEQEITDKFNAAWAKSLEHYPDLNDPNSAMYKEIQRLDAEAAELGDPLYDDPEKLWDFAKKAAVKTRTLMAKPKTQSPAPARGKTGSPVQPASGNARTTSADSNQAFAQKVEGLQTLDAYEEEIRALKGVA